MTGPKFYVVLIAKLDCEVGIRLQACNIARCGAGLVKQNSVTAWSETFRVLLTLLDLGCVLIVGKNKKSISHVKKCVLWYEEIVWIVKKLVQIVFFEKKIWWV